MCNQLKGDDLYASQQYQPQTNLMFCIRYIWPGMMIKTAFNIGFIPRNETTNQTLIVCKTTASGSQF